jgi:hypothetical protein
VLLKEFFSEKRKVCYFLLEFFIVNFLIFFCCNLEVDLKEKAYYEDLIKIRDKFKNLSVWRFKNGMQTLTDSLVDNLQKFNDVQLNSNEECIKIDFNKNNSNKVGITSTKNSYDFDYVISGIYSKC